VSPFGDVIVTITGEVVVVEDHDFGGVSRVVVELDTYLDFRNRCESRVVDSDSVGFAGGKGFVLIRFRVAVVVLVYARSPGRSRKND